jgi:hypothetical protein
MPARVVCASAHVGCIRAGQRAGNRYPLYRQSDNVLDRIAPVA